MTKKVASKDLTEAARKKAAEKRKKREAELKKVTAEDGILGLAGRMLDSNLAAKNAFDSAIKSIENHLEGTETIRKQRKDDYIKAMYVFDEKLDDYSSGQWDEDQELHQANLDALTGLRDAMEEEKKASEKDNESEKE